jgi:hypothetical protein
MQRNGDRWIRLGDISFGEVQVKRWRTNLVNYSIPSYTSGTSSTSLSWPTAVGDISLTMNESSLNLQSSSDLGSSSQELTIPTTIDPTFYTLTLGAGLSLSPGDTFVFYANSTNLIAFVVARYNSTTGSCYCFTSFYAGSGTFSSWSVKKEQMLYLYPTSFVSSRRAHVLVQSYDEGTKVALLKVIDTTGATFTVNSWVLTNLKQPNGVPGSQSNYYHDIYGGPLGCFFTVTFPSCSAGDVNHYKDNRGTGWRFIYVDGPEISNPPSDVLLDTYNVSIVAENQKTIFDNLTLGDHKWMGVSYTSPSGSSANSFAWIKATTLDTVKTASVF